MSNNISLYCDLKYLGLEGFNPKGPRDGYPAIVTGEYRISSYGASIGIKAEGLDVGDVEVNIQTQLFNANGLEEAAKFLLALSERLRKAS